MRANFCGPWAAFELRARNMVRPVGCVVASAQHGAACGLRGCVRATWCGLRAAGLCLRNMMWLAGCFVAHAQRDRGLRAAGFFAQLWLPGYTYSVELCRGN